MLCWNVVPLGRQRGFSYPFNSVTDVNVKSMTFVRDIPKYDFAVQVIYYLVWLDDTFFYDRFSNLNSQHGCAQLQPRNCCCVRWS